MAAERNTAAATRPDLFDRWVLTIRNLPNDTPPSPVLTILRRRLARMPWRERGELWLLVSYALILLLPLARSTVPSLTGHWIGLIYQFSFLVLIWWISDLGYRTVASMRDRGELQELLVTPLGAQQVMADIHCINGRRALLPFLTYLGTGFLLWLSNCNPWFFDMQFRALFFGIPMLLGLSEFGGRIALNLSALASPGELLLEFCLSAWGFLWGLTRRVVLWVALPGLIVFPLIYGATTVSPALGWVTGIICGTAVLIVGCVGFFRVTEAQMKRMEQKSKEQQDRASYNSLDL